MTHDLWTVMQGYIERDQRCRNRNRPTYCEIATTKSLWDERVDPDGNESDAFETLTLAEKLEILRDLFGPEEAE